MTEDTRTTPDTETNEEAHVKPASALAQVRSLLAGRWGSVAILAVASLLSGITESAILAIVAQAGVSLVSGAHHVHVSFGSLRFAWSINTLLLIALILAVIRLALQAVVGVLPAQIAAKVQGVRRTALFNAYTRASWSLQSRDREGHVQELVTNQVAQATSGALYTGYLVVAGLTFVMFVASALVLNVAAAIIVLAAAAGLFFLLRPLSTLGRQRSADLSRAYLDYAGAISEAVRLARETQVFGVGESQRKRLHRFIVRTQELFFKTQVLLAVPTTMYQSLVYLIIVLSLVALNAAHVGHIASLGAVILILIRAGTYAQQAQGAYQNVRQAVPYVERLERVQRGYELSVPKPGTRALEKVRALAFEDVSFAYDAGHPVLCGVSFEITGGETIGIAGPSGAGKSTLVEILLRLRAPSAGRYVVNGRSVHEFVDVDWQKRFAFVPQEPQLLHASVRDNIRFFRDLDDEAVERAARLAAIHDDVCEWAHGYDTIVGPRSDAVSGGQQQRICLARALAARPAVLVLDEPTSALDPHSEALIQRSLATLRSELTLFIVAHRMSTLDMCERVMVIINGRLEAFDSAALLRGSNAYYRSAINLAAGAGAAS